MIGCDYRMLARYPPLAKEMRTVWNILLEHMVTACSMSATAYPIEARFTYVFHNKLGKRYHIVPAGKDARSC